MSTSEDSSSLTNLRLADSPNGLDLRRVGAHPDYWYPVAWSDELKPGKVLGRRFAGEPIAIYRGVERPGVCAGGSLRAPAGAAAPRRGHAAMSSSATITAGPTCSSGKCVSVPYLGKERLPNGVKSYPAREVDGLIFVFPGRPGAGGGPPAAAARVHRSARTTRRGD